MIDVKRKINGTPASATGRRLIAPEDLSRFRVLSSPQLAPDGRRVVFIEKTVGAKNDYATNLWMAAVAESPGFGRRKPAVQGKKLPAECRCRQFTRGGNDSWPRWSPDGASIAFIRRSTAAKSQLYLIDAGGGEAQCITDFPEGSLGEFAWSPDGNVIAVRFRPREAQRTRRAHKRRRSAGLSEPPQVVEHLAYRFDGDGYFGADRHLLYLVNVKAGELRVLCPGEISGDFSFDFSPDAKQLAVAINRSPEPSMQPWKDEIVRIHLPSGRVTPIAGLPDGPKSAVRWSPDGETIAYAGREGNDSAYSSDNLDLFVCHPVRGDARNLTAKLDRCLFSHGITDTAVDLDAPVLRFSPNGRRIYMRYCSHGESHVASVAVRNGAFRLHTEGAIDVRLENLSADGQLAVATAADATTLAEIAVVDLSRPPGMPRRITDRNGPLLAELQLAVPRSHWIEAEDGHKVHLWCIEPPATAAAPTRKAKRPAVLQIHGGPHAHYCCSFFHEFQTLAAAGYMVFYSNPRGSKGYGRDHCAAIHGRWGTDDWTDIQAVTRFIKEHPQVDPARVGVMGGSYGGYMTNWAISHCRDFAAAITDRSLCNLVSFSGNTDVIEPPDSYFPGNFWDQAEARWEQSPLKHIGNVSTPTLIIHSDGDLRCNIEQADQLYAALKILGVRTRFVRYPATSSHGMSRNGPPDLRIHRLRQILDWWKEHLRDKLSNVAKPTNGKATAHRSRKR